MKAIYLPLAAAACAPALTGCNSTPELPKQPNVIVILADDMGVGDVSAYGSKAISTPNIDRLAAEGVRFTNGYATSATSTPSRYALMTGCYPWKNADAQILPGDAPLLISTEQYTLPKMMQSEGYTTAAIGKWHLGMGAGNIDWNSQISPSANDIGFNYTNLIAATNDRVPTVFVENGMVVGLEADDPLYVNYKENFEGEPTAISNPELMTMMWDHGHNYSVMNGIPRIGYQKGGNSAYWVDEDMADYFAEQVKDFIRSSDDKPFFLYYGLHQPHVPRAPHSRFVGATELGPRGDAVVEADWCVGELIAFLEAEGLLENTLIIYSSDNGAILNDGYVDGAVELNDKSGHTPSGESRGGKYSLFEGGSHVPFIAYWKGVIEPKISDALISHIDIMPSLAQMLGIDTPQVDGERQLETILGKSDSGRASLIHEAFGRLSYRKGDWALIPAYNGVKVTSHTCVETGYDPEITLWNIAKDPSQQTELSAEHPEIKEQMWQELTEITREYYTANENTISVKK